MGIRKYLEMCDKCKKDNCDPKCEAYIETKKLGDNMSNTLKEAENLLRELKGEKE